jgi:hypothetical protein
MVRGSLRGKGSPGKDNKNGNDSKDEGRTRADELLSSFKSIQSFLSFSEDALLPFRAFEAMAPMLLTCPAIPAGAGLSQDDEETPPCIS